MQCHHDKKKDCRQTCGAKKEKTPQEEQVNIEDEEENIREEEITPKINLKISLPQRLTKSKNEEDFERFAKMLRKLTITLPLTELNYEIPSYTKFLKDIISRKRKVEDNEYVSLSKMCQNTP